MNFKFQERTNLTSYSQQYRIISKLQFWAKNKNGSKPKFVHRNITNSTIISKPNTAMNVTVVADNDIPVK